MSYELIDSGDGFKLEQFGPIRLERPCQAAFWKPTLPASTWQEVHARFSRKEGLHWEVLDYLPKSWEIDISGLKMLLKPTDFGHLGVFPEQIAQWAWIKDKISKAKRASPPSVLNLFAYSGGATLSAAQAGAAVCHVDASKGMVDWARQNATLNGLDSAPIRWIVDDVFAFLKREIKRGNRYDAIIMDPPSFGRGAKQEVFKLEKDLDLLLSLCRQLFSDNPLFFFFSCHTPGFTPVALRNLVQQTLDVPKGEIEAGEMLLEGPKANFSVPSGFFARWSPIKS